MCAIETSNKLSLHVDAHIPTHRHTVSWIGRLGGFYIYQLIPFFPYPNKNHYAKSASYLNPKQDIFVAPSCALYELCRFAFSSLFQLAGIHLPSTYPPTYTAQLRIQHTRTQIYAHMYGERYPTFPLTLSINI